MRSTRNATHAKFLVLSCVALLMNTSPPLAAERGAEFPSAEALSANSELPDPFMFIDGSRVATRADWARRRDEIKSLVQHYVYGQMPPPPGNVTASEISSAPVFNDLAVERLLILKMGPEEKIRVHVRLVIPHADHAVPVIVLNHHEHPGATPVDREMIERGYALAIYDRTDLDPDDPHAAGPAETAYPEHDWATLAMWAWGGMRVLDYLETLPSIDASKAVITGHSRGGKTALLAGALDERFAMIVANGSGCGGSGCFRILGPDSETLEAITDPERFAYWFHPRLREFAKRADRLPLDAHFLKALVAPRAFLSTDALDDHWANPLGTQVTHVAAQEVYDFLGASDRNAQHYRDGDHDQNAEDWRALLDFADLTFFDRATSRKFSQRPFGDAPRGYSWRSPPNR